MRVCRVVDLILLDPASTAIVVALATVTPLAVSVAIPRAVRTLRLPLIIQRKLFHALAVALFAPALLLRVRARCASAPRRPLIPLACSRI